MNDIDPQEFGRLQAHVETLVVSVEKLTQQVAAMDQRLAEAKGGWRVLMAIGGASAGVGALIAPVLQKLFKVLA